VAKSKNNLDISVLIATYNRAEIIRKTLEGMTGLDRDGLSVEFVVVDNNSSDHTKEVIESFTDRLSLRYFFEPRPGKNCALNKALNEVKLGKLVAFTDDDVEPKKDWLKAIVAATQRWPQVSVFGGKIYPLWLSDKLPKWIESPSVQSLCFAAHDHANRECIYQRGKLPFGPNFWVRREIFAAGLKFDEAFGPRPKNRLMGSETSFLRHLADEGHQMVYCPSVELGHRIGSEQISIRNALKRSYRLGRALAHMGSPCQVALLRKYPILWYFIRVLWIVGLTLLLLASLVMLVFQKPRRAIGAMRHIGRNIESWRIAGKRSSNIPSTLIGDVPVS